MSLSKLPCSDDTINVIGFIMKINKLWAKKCQSSNNYTENAQNYLNEAVNTFLKLTDSCNFSINISSAVVMILSDMSVTAL